MEKRQQSFVNRLKAADRQAAAEFVDKYYERIYLLFRRLGHGRGVSEDLTQETFLQVWQHIAQLRDSVALESWLYHIAANVSRRHWRWHKSHKTASTEGLDFVRSIEKDSSSTAELEDIARLKESLLNLSPKLKEAVVLHYMQHLTIVQAARAVGIRENTFKSRLNRALRRLRSQLKAWK
ncbi:MAG: RNA polymerase sigma factor [Sedimentisphaerales bacterium]|nr:RNA polymerase sigma factor [Sedimentisphaerales bacterium]